MDRQQQHPRTVAAMATIVLGVTCVLPLSSVRAGDRLSAALSHTCAIRSDGTLACWGENSSGETNAVGGTYVQISSTELHNCARTAGGALWCFGYTEWVPPLFALPNPQPGTFRQVSAGGLHTCGVNLGNTSITCWGDGDFFGENFPAAPNSGYRSVESGWRHVCAARNDDSAACWGSNANGQAPTAPPGLYSQVSAGGLHSCGLHTNGSVECWGLNANGQTTAPTGPFVEVQAGWAHSCARRVDGTVACWGANNALQVSDTPTTAFAEISAGYFHNCGIVLATGAVECWGDDQFGQSAPLPGDYRAATAQSALTSLASQVTALGGTVSKPLLASMTGASVRLNDGNPANDKAACGKLGATRNKLAEFVASDRIDDATGLSLIGQTVAIRNQIGC